MEFFKRTTNIDFMGIRLSATIVSLVLLIGSIGALISNGLNWGIEFTGGTEVQVVFPHDADIPVIRDTLLDSGFKDVKVQTYGPLNSVMIHLSGKQDLTQKDIGFDVSNLLPQSKVKSVSYIGPQVGKELAVNGALALFVAMLGTGIYIALRFEYRLAVSAAAALIHDPIIILGVFALLGIEFDLISLAAILTIIGYSLNDTIVVFDRIRENFRKLRKAEVVEVVNLSVNETLSRTIITSGLTFIAVLALFLYGGEALYGFSLALLIGIVVGTYSSIYVAGAFAVMLGLNRKDLLPPAKELIDDRP